MKWLSVLQMRQAMTFQRSAAFENAPRARRVMRKNDAGCGVAAHPCKMMQQRKSFHRCPMR